MYIIRNALKCIGRSRSRNILIGVIVLVIAVSSCLGLSIRQAAEDARLQTMDGLRVTATISYDRRAAMENIAGQRGEGELAAPGIFDRDAFAETMEKSDSLTLEEYKKYAEAASVQAFYYSLTTSFNGNDSLLPVSAERDTSEDSSLSPGGRGDFGGGGPGGFGGMMMGAQSDFQVIGYSGEDAMTAFVDGTATVTEGVVFDEGTTERNCLISQELAVYNSIAVGDTITLVNPNNEEESYSFTVVGLYSDNEANENSFSMMGATSFDPANRVYVSYAALADVVAISAKGSETVIDEDSGREYQTAITGTLAATYVLPDVAAYEQFETDVRSMGLEDSYTVSSADLQSYETALVPLETLSKMAGYFLIVILLIGAVILVVLNIFHVRERKYEIGVLAAMGMKKWKVALQFLTESFVVTLAAVLIGIAIGGVTALPVTNALLENQVASQNSRQEQMNMNFGRGDMPSNMPGGNAPQMSSGGRGEFFGNAVDYVTEIDNAMNFTVVWQMLGVALLLTVVAGMVSMLFVMRYDPLRILANRD